jgi:signal transduction histidine kinase
MIEGGFVANFPRPFPAAVRRLLGPRPVILIGSALVLGALFAAFAYVLVDSQSESRRQAERRFDAQASISADLMASLLTSSVASAETEATRLFASKSINVRRLTAVTKSPGVSYAFVLDAQGRVIGASPGTPAGRPRSGVHIRKALSGQATLSDVLPGPGTKHVLEWAFPYTTPFGRRVAVEGLDPVKVFAFLNLYLNKTRSNGNGAAFILDSQGRVVSVAGATGVKVGGRPKAAALVAALAARPSGIYHYSGARYFATSPVGGSPWRVVLSVPTSRLFPSLVGSKSWLLFSVLGAFALVGLASLIFFRRALVRGAQLNVANRELRTVNSTLEERVAERTAAAEERAVELARSNEELEQFSSVASHDLQEPLRKIRMFGERLRERLGDSLAEEPAADLERMGNAAERMQKLINDLLDFSRVTHRGKAFEPVELDAVTREVVADLEARVVELGARVEIGQLPTIDADRTQMRQLMQNLIGNALKFHRDGESPLVRIQADVIPAEPARFPGESTAGARCVLTVRDNGIGFDAKHSERVFTAFERLHGRSAYEGTGIGLSIARKIVWRHGGEISAESVLDEGATFTVTLPLSQLNGRNGKAA